MIRLFLRRNTCASRTGYDAIRLAEHGFLLSFLGVTTQGVFSISRIASAHHLKFNLFCDSNHGRANLVLVLAEPFPSLFMYVKIAV